ncbi:MAG: alpha/beta hydrolase [Planctomycetes bacterium]|nr:alpha/beta hydrolase [Planctomycetota bacterium]
MGGSTRTWLEAAHAELEHTLPRSARAALLTGDLTDAEGRPRDVLAHFGLKRDGLHTIRHNFSGLRQTFNGIGMESFVDEEAPVWEGFENVWVPVADDLSLYGRIGYACEEGRIRDADCIVILPGFFGDAGVTRTRDLARALVDAGYHALAIEIRGHGRTEYRYPDKRFTFGVLESIELLRVDEWLRAQPHVERTGLMGFCWGANVAMITAWMDGVRESDHSIGSHFQRYVPARSVEPHFAAGVMAFSPALNFEVLIDQLEEPVSALSNAMVYGIQSTIELRMRRKGYGPPLHSLRWLIDQEYAHSEIGLSPEKHRQMFRFLRMLEYRGRLVGDKFESIRIPTLVVHSGNDPFITADSVAQFMTAVKNPNIAALILPAGGHVGLATYSRRYYYSLIMNFFDRERGPAGRGDPVHQADASLPSATARSTAWTHSR